MPHAAATSPGRRLHNANRRPSFPSSCARHQHRTNDKPSYDGSLGHLHRPPHLTESAATCDLRISRSLPPLATSASHGAPRLLRPPHLTEPAIGASPLLSSPPGRHSCLRWSQYLPSAANLAMVVAGTWCCTRPPVGAPCSFAHAAALTWPPSPWSMDLLRRQTPSSSAPATHAVEHILPGKTDTRSAAEHLHRPTHGRSFIVVPPTNAATVGMCTLHHAATPCCSSVASAPPRKTSAASSPRCRGLTSDRHGSDTNCWR